MLRWCARCQGEVVAVGHREDPSCVLHGPLGHGAGRGWVELPVARRRRDLYPNAGRLWTEAERRWVFEWRHRLSSAEMGWRLGRSPHSIDQLLSKASLRKRRAAGPRNVTNGATSRGGFRGANSRISPEEEALLEDAAAPGSLTRWVPRTGRTPGALRVALWRRGVKLREADGMLSASEVGRRYHLSRWTVQRWIGSGRLPAVRSGRFVRVDPSDAERVCGGGE